MLPQRKLMFGLAFVCLLAGLALFPGLRIFSRPPRNPDAKEGGGLSAHKASEWLPVVSSKRRPASRIRVEDQWAIRWQELNRQPEGPERDREMAALLEELAASDPMRALALAETETNPERCVEFFQAVLRGWSGTNPEAAIAWAASQTLMDQGQAMSAVFHGAARDPENALRLTAQLSAQDPERAGDYGSYLVAALNRAGEFNRAAAFAVEAPAEIRVDLLNAAFAGWGDREPQSALKAIGHLSDPEAKTMAFDAAISHWADHDAKGVAEYAMDLPAGREKTFALTVALRDWVGSDAPEAAVWMSRFDASPELDMGAAVVASLPESLQQPQVATSWAESIVDPRLRVRVLASLVNEWAMHDPVAARNYAETSPNLRPEDRPGVLAAFEPDFNPLSLSP